MTRQIVAMGGGGFLMEPELPLLDDFVLELARGADSRVCFVPTAAGDSPWALEQFYDVVGPRCRPAHLSLFNREHADIAAFLRAHDVVYVGGGNTVNMLAVWRAHGVDRALVAAYEAGVMVCGVSAGAICWFAGGVTDSYGPLARLDDGLGLVAASFCPHYDGDPERRPAYRREVAAGLLPGWGVDDGAALHFVDGELREAVASRPGARAWRVERHGSNVLEAPLATRLLGAR